MISHLKLTHIINQTFIIMYTTFNENMEKHRILIWNASDDLLIQPRLENYGYTIDALQAGKDLWTRTDGFDKKQDQEMSEQKSATNSFNEAWQKEVSEIKRLKKLARLVFETNSTAWDMLKLKVLNISRFENWQANAELVCTNLLANSAWITSMQSFGYTAESITAIKDRIEALKGLQQGQKREMGDAQQATDNKWKSYDELRNWCYKLLEVAKIEFEDDPQLLEKLGILARSKA